MTKLPDDFPAVAFLREDRGFGPEVWARHKLGYCHHCENYPQAAGRIIAPVYLDDELRSWQARYVGPEATRRGAKYYTRPGAPMGRLLYNLDGVREASFLVFFEGVTDVWRLPSLAVGVFGNTLKEGQAATLNARIPPETPAVVWFDPGAEAEAQKARDLLRRSGRPALAIVSDQDDRDPGARSGSEILHTIKTQAHAAGFELPGV